MSGYVVQIVIEADRSRLGIMQASSCLPRFSDRALN